MLHFFTNSLHLIIVIFGLTPSLLCVNWKVAEREEVLRKLYTTYRKALDNDEEIISFRRVLGNNREYDIHVHKLVDVNGLKRHNLIIKEKSDDNPVIYINNPVETQMPNAYLSLQEFKDVLTGRVLRQRIEFSQTKRAFHNVKQTRSTKRNVIHFPRKKPKTQFKKRTTINNILKFTPKRNKITSKTRNVETKVPVTKKLVMLTTKIPTWNTSHGKIESVPHITETKPIAIKLSTKKLIMIPVSITTKVTTSKVIHNLNDTSTTTNQTANLDILRINAKEKQILENKYKPIALFSRKELSTARIKLYKSEPITELIITHPTKPNVFTEESTTKETTTEPTSKVPNREETTTERTTPQYTTIEGTTTQSTTTEEPTTVKVTIKKTITEEPATSKRTTKESTTEESTTVESTTKETTTEEQTTEVPEESTTKETTSNKPRTEEPTTEESTTEGSTTKDSTTEEKTTEEPTTTESTTDEQTTTTVKTTTKLKRISLARPLVFMGGWDRN